MTVDYAAVTERQQKMWSLGDYGRIGSLLSLMGERLVYRLDIHAGEKVLDIAAGNGNASLPAVHRFADVLATDYVPELLAEAQKRAEAEGFSLTTRLADAQALPFADAGFDVVMSTIGAMFAPDQQKVAQEMIRVCRPGGRIGVTAWCPDSLVGDMLRTVSSRIPPPQGLRPPVAWGDEQIVRDLLGPGCRHLDVQRTSLPWRYPSAQACMEHFKSWYGPTVAALRAVGEDGREAFESDLLAVFAPYTAPDGTMAADVDYLEVIGVRD